MKTNKLKEKTTPHFFVIEKIGHKIDGTVKSRISCLIVIPAKAGIY